MYLSQQLILRTGLSVHSQQLIRLLQLNQLDLQQDIEQMIEDNLFLDSRITSNSTSQRYVGEQDWLQGLAAPVDKRAELVLQIKSLRLDELTKEAMCYLVDWLTDEGFLALELPELCVLFSEQTGYESNTLLLVFQRALDQLKDIDQQGIGCKNIADYLCWQLEQQAIATDTLLYQLCQQHLVEVAEEKWVFLCRKMQCNRSQLQQAVQQLKQLRHQPLDLGSQEINTADLVYPDLYLTKTAAGFEVALYQMQIEPYLRQDYERVLKQANKGAEQEALQRYWQQAKDYLSALQVRQHTVLTVAQYLVDYQRAFFVQGLTQLRPLNLEQVAQETGVSISTISRICRQKYLSGPQGIMALNELLAHSITEHNETTAKNLAARIQYHVDNENKKYPFSDTYLVNLLAQEGIQCARRTVSKYRQQMNIPNTKYRQQDTTTHSLS